MPDKWVSARTEAGGAIVEAFPGEEPGTFGATVHVAGELAIEQGAAAIEAVMVKLMEQVETPADFARVQQAIVGRLAGVPGGTTAPELEKEPERQEPERQEVGP